MRSRSWHILSLALALASWASPVRGEEPNSLQQRQRLFENLPQEMARQAMELKELEIRAKIYEPQVVYILDRARIEVHFKEDDLKFSPRIPDVIEENAF